MNTISLLILVLLAAGTAQAEPPKNAEIGNHLDSPVYYERYDEPLLPNEENLELLHNGLLKLRHFPPVDITDFKWTGGGIDDFSWWIQVEELRFLLPFIESDRPQDRALARRWFESWYSSQQSTPHVNVARWGEAMSAAYRGMVLVYYLKSEVTRSQPDVEITGMLRGAIAEHQRFLADSRNFHVKSNHGMVEAMGLLEVTRVFPDRDLQRLGLERMLLIVDKSVSDKGTHMEHSPAYHFVFLDWLDRYADYLADQPFLDRDLVSQLFGYRERMVDAAYYMQDHGGTMAQIGDSDSVQVSDRYPDYRLPEANGRQPVLYDTEAGFAVYKGNSKRGDRRFVVFANQSDVPQLPYHFHNDVLSVYYAYDGEVLLGDAGKYEYSPSRERGFFRSAAAHNTVFPIEYLRTRKRGHAIFVADSVAYESEPRSAVFYGRISHTSADVERRVVVPKNGSAVAVVDAITWPPGKWGKRRGGTARGKPHYTAVVWNLGPGVESVEEIDAAGEMEYEWLLTGASGRKYRLRLSVEAGGADSEGVFHRIEIHFGSRNPMMGWYSPAQFVMRRQPSILLTVRPQTALRVTTSITPVTEIPSALRILLRGY